MTELAMPWLQVHIDSLRLEYQRGHLGHAPLLHGPRGIGKAELARWLASGLLCQGATEGQLDPCGACPSCQLMASGTHPDYFDVTPVDEGKAIVVDQIRELIDKIALTPAIGSHRVAVIAPAEAMNINAANAVLKTLEEPPDNVWLILVCDALSKLPPTILSRCQKVAIHPPPALVASDWLEAECPEANAELRDRALKMAAGAPCLARDLIARGHVEGALEVFAVLVEIAKGGGVRPDLAEQWGNEAREVWSWLAYWVSELALSGAAGDAEADIVALAEKSQSQDWSELWANAVEGLSMSQTGIRQDLLLGRWLLAWEQQFLKP